MENNSQSLESNLDQYDLIPLPSGGKFYDNKLAQVYVTFLNGSDETLFMSPNLLKNGNLIDELLKRKIKGGKTIEGEDISVDPLQLLDGDRIAILVYLRAIFEPIYRIYYDNDPDERYYDFDLSTLELKKLDTNYDTNKDFTYTLPKSKDIVTYRFLTGQDQKIIREAQKKNVSMTNDSVIDNLCRQVTKVVLKKDGTTYDDGIMIKKYLKELNLRDFRNLNKYISDNTPSIDLKVSIPSLSGGETIETFLPITSEFFFPTN